MELDRFVDGVNANPHLTRLAVAASGLALDRFVDGVHANPPRKTARTRKPHDIQRLATTQPGAPFVSPPWFAIPTLYRENRASFRDRRTDNEERRASARRGFVNRVCKCNAMNFRVSRAHARSAFHGGLTPPAPGCTHACRRGCAVVLCNGVSFATGGLRPPLLIAARSFVRGKPPFAMHKRTSGQERRASARRGSRYRRCTARTEYRSATDERTTKSGGREPAVVCTRWRVAHGVRQITCKHVSRTTGGLRPPAPGCTHACRRGCAVVLCNGVSFATGGLRPPLLIAARSFARGKPPFAMHKRTSGQERRSSARRGVYSVERSTWCAANHLQPRFPNHGGLTPPAPGCTHACRRGCAVVLCNGVSFATGGLRPPLGCTHAFVVENAVVRCTRRFICHGGLTPPALDCCTIVRPWKTAFCDAQTHVRSRAPGVSPPWFARRCTAERASFGDGRTDNDEERRASARRGFVNRVCKCNAMNFRVSRAHARSAFHGGLTPPAPGCTHACRRGCAVVLCNGVSFATGGLRPPLLIAARSFVRGKPPFAMHKRTSGQEQQASVRGQKRLLTPLVHHKRVRGLHPDGFRCWQPSRQELNSAIRGAWFALGPFSMFAGKPRRKNRKPLSRRGVH
jgi:predicted metal-binding protein